MRPFVHSGEKMHFLYQFILAAALTAVPAKGGHAQTSDVYEANILAKEAGQLDPGEMSLAPVSVLALADQLANYARRSGSVPAYVLGAELYSAAMEMEPGGDQSEGISRAAFLDEARNAARPFGWARNRMEMLDELELKGRVSKPLVTVQKTGPDHATSVRFVGGEIAIVYARPKPGRPVRLSIFDQNGAVACRTEWLVYGNQCSWTPRWTGAFRIEVESLLSTDEIEIVTN